MFLWAGRITMKEIAGFHLSKVSNVNNRNLELKSEQVIKVKIVSALLSPRLNPKVFNLIFFLWPHFNSLKLCCYIISLFSLIFLISLGAYVGLKVYAAGNAIK